MHDARPGGPAAGAAGHMAASLSPGARPLSWQIMVGEGILYCCLAKRRSGVGLEPNINAGGCNFNSFLRRAVRFVGECASTGRGSGGPDRRVLFTDRHSVSRAVI